jgi:signal peptidase I
MDGQQPYDDGRDYRDGGRYRREPHPDDDRDRYPAEEGSYGDYRTSSYGLPAPSSYGDPSASYGPQPTYGGSRHSATGGSAPYSAVPARPSPSPEDDEEDNLSWRQRAMRRRRNMPLWQELPLLLIVAFCLAVLIRTFLMQAFYIPSGSMEDTLRVGDRVLVNKIVYDVRQPRRGEIVVFEGTDNWTPEYTQDNNAGFFAKLGRTVGDLVGISQPGEKDFIKRVVGLPGDVVACCDVNGRVTVNGKPLDEPYVTDNSPLEAEPTRGHCGSRRFEPVTVEQGQMFVMGDHRLVSQDSRCQGQVPIDHVIGQAFVVVWPSSRWNSLPVPSTFNNLPKPFGAAAPSSGQVPADRDMIGVTLLLPLMLVRSNPARSRRLASRRGRRLRG